jgi:lysophospholipase L1-like esterase
VIEEKQIGKRENKHIAQYAAIVRDLANAMSLPLVDLYKIMNGRKDLINLLLDDGLHFSHAGYDLFAQHIIERINCLEENKKKA